MAAKKLERKEVFDIERKARALIDGNLAALLWTDIPALCQALREAWAEIERLGGERMA